VLAARLYQMVIDSHDLRSPARFWAAVLDQKILYESDEEVIVGGGRTSLPGVLFVPVPESKKLLCSSLERSIKNPLHIDLDPGERDAEVEQIPALGARRADVGQGDDVSCPRRAAAGGTVR